MLLPTKDDEMTGSLSNDQHLQVLQEEILLKIDDEISTIGDAHLDQSLGKRPKDRVAETHIPWTSLMRKLIEEIQLSIEVRCIF